MRGAKHGPLGRNILIQPFHLRRLPDPERTPQRSLYSHLLGDIFSALAMGPERGRLWGEAMFVAVYTTVLGSLIALSTCPTGISLKTTRISVSSSSWSKNVPYSFGAASSASVVLSPNQIDRYHLLRWPGFGFPELGTANRR